MTQGKRVALCDSSPTASQKWWPAVVLQKPGALTYELNVEGHKRQAHVDHLQPWTSIDDKEGDQNLLPGQFQTLVPDQQRPCDSVTTKSDHLVEMPTVDQSVVDQSTELLMEDPLLSSSEMSAFNTRPECRKAPPKRLIEILN